MSEHLNKEEEDLLQSALSDAFSPAEVTRVSTQPSEKQEAPESAPPAPVPAAPVTEAAGSTSAPAEEEWKAEYEHHLADWRARSAEQREKAEATRAHWEKVREQEEKEGKSWEDRVLAERRRYQKLSESEASVSGWESVRAATEGRASPSPADVRDLTTGEAQGHRHATQSSTFSSPPAPSQEQSRPDSEPESSKHEKWEEVPSDLASSYPSLTYPSDPHSPASPHRHRHLHGEHAHPHPSHHHPHHHHEPTQHTATSAIFDPQLSTKTRVLALLSSLGINLLLPFVNGVMLGFGEIFAREVVFSWLGWKLPATSVGIRARPAAPVRK